MNSEKEKPVDIIEKSIGVLGRWHLWVCFIVFLVKFPVAWHQLSIVFEAPPADFSCIDRNLSKCAKECTTHIFNRTIFEETIISQWDLVCNKSYLANLAQTVTMLGILMGSLVFGYLSDRFGRKNPLTWAVILQLVSGVGAAYSPWFELHLVMRFLTSAATGGTMVTSFVLIMELVGTKWRTCLGILYQLPFNLGHLTLALFGYLMRDWKYLQLAISLPSIILISYYWLLPESPRWLLTVGQEEEAIELLEKAAHHNKLPIGEIRENIKVYLQKKEKETKTQDPRGNILDLVRTPVMRMYTICICFNWLVCGLCFYGVAQFIGQLAGNIFLNVAFSAIIQVPGTIFSVWALDYWGRKKTLITANTVSGVCLLLICVVPANPLWIKTTLSCISMFGLAVCFPTVYIYSGELFPTLVRNIGVGTCSVCARIGSMSAPFIVGFSSFSTFAAPLVFGIVALVGAVLCFKLPETLNCKLPDSVEEAENFSTSKSALNNDSVEMSSS